MKMYVIEIRAVQRSPYDRSYLNTVLKFQLTLEGDLPLVKEGEWSVSDAGVVFLGRSDGFWRVFSDPDDRDVMLISLQSRDNPGLIASLWRGAPDNYGMLQGILKFPLFLGETGGGFIGHGRGKTYEATWKIMRAGFW